MNNALIQLMKDGCQGNGVQGGALWQMKLKYLNTILQY